MDDLDKIYKKHKHEKAEPATLSVDRFMTDGKPTCMSWYGDKLHPRMACRFIWTHHFGTRYMCGISGDRLNDDLTPTENCPLWNKEKQKTFAEAYMAGEITIEQIDNYIYSWNESDSEQPMHEFLGLTWDECSLFVMNWKKFKLYMENKRKEQNNG